MQGCLILCSCRPRAPRSDATRWPGSVPTAEAARWIRPSGQTNLCGTPQSASAIFRHQQVIFLARRSKGQSARTYFRETRYQPSRILNRYMKYIGTPDYQHGTRPRLGVLLVNLGTPEAAETGPVRRYLAEFLSDPRIIELPRWLWLTLLHLVILRIRPPRSAKAYQEVWSEETGSPLLDISRKQKAALGKELEARYGDDVVVALGMRYGNPSIESALAELREADVRRLVVLPMYPQYSGTTTASVFDEVTSCLQRTRWIPELRFINQFSDEPAYIEALAASVRESWEQHGRGELLVTSYHGIPKRYLLNGDPYHCLCHKTTRQLAEALGLGPDKYRVVFQSRVGREEWLRPYCDETMKQLPGEGITSIDIISPAFSADCLETIEEISGENHEYFVESGGKRFQYISCLNDRADHIRFLADLVSRHAQGWPETDTQRNREHEQKERDATAQRAQTLIDAA